MKAASIWASSLFLLMMIFHTTVMLGTYADFVVDEGSKRLSVCRPLCVCVLAGGIIILSRIIWLHIRRRLQNQEVFTYMYVSICIYICMLVICQRDHRFYGKSYTSLIYDTILKQKICRLYPYLIWFLSSLCLLANLLVETVPHLNLRLQLFHALRI